MGHFKHRVIVCRQQEAKPGLTPPLSATSTNNASLLRFTPFSFSPQRRSSRCLLQRSRQRKRRAARRCFEKVVTGRDSHVLTQEMDEIGWIQSDSVLSALTHPLSMYKHACAVLSAAEAWSWPAPSCMDINESFNKGSEFKTVCRRLLLCLIIESQSLGGSLLESFWTEFEKSHSQFPENVNELRNTAYSSFEDTLQILYDNVDPKTVEFSSIFALATELFTHIGLPFMNEDDRVWRALTPLSTFSPSTPGQTRYEQRRENLKVMVLKRDGTSCPFSEIPYYGMGGVAPIMAYVIPSSIRSKPETLKYLSIIAGHNATDSILQSGDTIDNALAVEGSIAASYRRNCWALEACESPDNVNHATYYFKAFEPGNLHRAGSVLLRDGDEITFGQGPTGTQNRNGPHPLLCNLRLAVSRALYTSGAAEFIGQLMQDADDMDCRHVALQKNFHRALSAKLLISGRAQMI